MLAGGSGTVPQDERRGMLRDGVGRAGRRVQEVPEVTGADTMLQHQGFVRALNSQAKLKGFEPTDTGRKLYGVA